LEQKIDSVVTIKVGLENLIARSIDKKTISDGVTVSCNKKVIKTP
jgi:hypothetical protein